MLNVQCGVFQDHTVTSMTHAALGRIRCNACQACGTSDDVFEMKLIQFDKFAKLLAFWSYH